MTKHSQTNLPVNLKEINATFTFSIVFRDMEHFKRVISYLNSNVGRGKNLWTTDGRIQRFLRRGLSIKRNIYIFKKDFDESIAVYISLL